MLVIQGRNAQFDMVPKACRKQSGQVPGFHVTMTRWHAPRKPLGRILNQKPFPKSSFQGAELSNA